MAAILINTTGHNLRMLRFKNNYTQRQVAEALNISTNSVIRYENNQVQQNKGVIQKFADFYEVNIEDILRL